MTDRGFFIDGRWDAAPGAERFDLRNPATGELIGRTALASGADIDRAVQAAVRAAPVLAGTSARERGGWLLRAADLLEARADDMARLLTREQGKPVGDNLKEILFGAEVLRYYAAEGQRVNGSLRPASAPHVRNLVSYHPVGVAGAIVPWNYPIDLYCWKVGPAIAAGCPLVVKSPQETPLAIAMLVDCLHEAGVPPGAIADLPGLGPVAGAALAAHPQVRLISATASIPAGQAIMRAAAGNLKRLSLELGGHAPFIVMPGADIDEAARACHRRAFSNMGQICITVNRVLVAASIKDEFSAALAALAQETVLGNGLEDGVGYGPVQNPSVIARTERHIGDAVAKGGRVIAGGARATGGDLARGQFFRPTVIADAPLDSLPMNEESFGPLVAMATFHDEAGMLAMANALEYGLAAYLYDSDLERAWALGERLEFGAVGINVNDTSELQAPFGGWKMSGFGRELGPEGLMAWLEPKHLKMRVRPR
ncbi:MAG: aldehyde dehydrogenase family protein [Rubellimicrobium sp.]|nr:aldehyde dehydrogenase family protein [Rubellimicrobium sp.]